MEIKILNHPSDEPVARRIGEVLSDNGISVQLTHSAQEATNDVHIAVSSTSAKEEAPLLTSSFVHLDSTPGY